MNKNIQKRALFFPEITVMRDFLPLDKLIQLKDFFRNELPNLAHKNGEDEGGINTCKLIQLKIEPVTPLIEELFSCIKTRLVGMDIAPTAILDKLHFYRCFLKYYRLGDEYHFHEDVSESGISFVFQTTLNDKTV